ncbi:NAD-binding protein [Fomitopsis schrenkii]|uniref:NAD-binding protein n=1 Tax=Fomitopsis schrenkii TaxID=2126942 RepID=S8F9H1_FOMSC|nr:NAD-binding protein [Fomitopsis schrenkii]
MSTKVWFITGASSGFGRGITELALEKGDIAVATLRKPEMISDLAAKYTSKHLLVLKVDVLKPAEIRAAFDEAVKAYGRIDVVFNNAGYNVIGEVEATTDQIARAVFDVNFFGAVNVSKEAVRTFRDVNKPQGGRLIQMSSMVVHNDPAGYAFYAATKCALNAVSDALALEVDPEWNIKIIEVESGAFNTNVMQSTVRTEAHPAYSKPTLVGNQVRNLLAGTTSPPGTPTLSEAEDPPRHLPLGKDAVKKAQTRSAELLENAQKVASWSEGLDAVDYRF